MFFDQCGESVPHRKQPGFDRVVGGGADHTSSDIREGIAIDTYDPEPTTGQARIDSEDDGWHAPRLGVEFRHHFV
mgnify:FL=1